jgi:hypothetical protein
VYQNTPLGVRWSSWGVPEFCVTNVDFEKDNFDPMTVRGGPVCKEFPIESTLYAENMLADNTELLTAHGGADVWISFDPNANFYQR